MLNKTSQWREPPVFTRNEENEQTCAFSAIRRLAVPDWLEHRLWRKSEICVGKICIADGHFDFRRAEKYDPGTNPTIRSGRVDT